MCPVEEIISCQLSFTPIQTNNHIADINLVLDIITSRDVEYLIGEMSTIIKGNRQQILSLIGDIFGAMTDKCSFVMDIKLSNTCGCQRQMSK